MKRIRKVMLLVGLGLGLFALSPVATVVAQDAAYLTPSRAKKIRADRAQKEEEARRLRAERRAKAEAERQKAIAEYKDNVSDWYNRRGLDISDDEMEENLERLDGNAYQEGKRAKKGGKYSQRLRRFGDNDNIVVLENVDRVYVVDDFLYDPWTSSYYGRDWDSGVNISINVGPYWGWNSWSYHHWPWYDYYTWSYPWYDPWYYPSYSWRWHYPYRYYGWGWTYSPWRNYDYGYWHGYNDAAWDHGYSWGYYDNNRYYNRSRRVYDTYGRSGGGYYDRNATSSEYGRALGHGLEARSTRSGSARSGRYYDRSSTRSYNDDYGTRSSGTSRNWDRGSSSSSGSWSSGSSSTRSSGGYSSSPVRNSGSSGSGSNSRSTGSSRRTR